MVFLLISLLLNQQTHEIILKNSPSLVKPFYFTSQKQETLSLKGKGFEIIQFLFDPDRIAYVTDTTYTSYRMFSFDWNINDTVLCYFYYPDNDTTTGAPTGEHVRGDSSYWTHTYEDSVNLLSYWKWYKNVKIDTYVEMGEGVYIKRCYTYDELNDFWGGGWGIRFSPAPLEFYSSAFFPGEWYVEIWRKPAGGDVYFVKRDSFEVRDTFTYVKLIFPSDTDTVVYGKENIILEVLENHWAKVKLKITSVNPEKGETRDTTIEFKIYRMKKPKRIAIPFDFGFSTGAKYKIVADITDYSGNRKVDSTFCVVGRSNIDVVLNPPEVLPRNIPGMPQYGNRTEVIVRVKTPSGRPISGWPIFLEARGVPGSGGHDHCENRPAGDFQQNNGQTDENGEFRTFYFASEFGGIERIIASGGEIRDSANLTVRVPDLYLLPESEYYVKYGSPYYAQFHHTPPAYSDDHTHWGKEELINAIYTIAWNYVLRGGEIIYINDMSLPYGGLFDIQGNWRPPHKTHRTGRNADVSGRGPGGTFLHFAIMKDIIQQAGDSLNVNIEYKWHGDHYHFIVTPRR
jgi:hypothetical protein